MTAELCMFCFCMNQLENCLITKQCQYPFKFRRQKIKLRMPLDGSYFALGAEEVQFTFAAKDIKMTELITAINGEQFKLTDRTMLAARGAMRLVLHFCSREVKT